MGRCLLVANQTLGGRALAAAVRERIAVDDTFYVVVPMTRPEHETTAWVGVPEFQVPPTVEAGERSPIEEARRRSEHRLETVLESIREAGGLVDGEVGVSDPLEAVQAVLEREPFDEIVVSTLPTRLSRWLGMDLPSRLDRHTDVPVTTIIAEE